MSLDEKISSFLSLADEKSARSKLEPYADLIRKLRQRRWTYTEIARALHDDFGVTVHRTTVHAYVKVRSGKGKGVLAMSTPETTSAAIKPVPANPPGRRRFNLDA